MKTIKVISGLGYYTDGKGHIVCKAELPAGDNMLADDLNYKEVDTRAELDAIQIYEDQATIDIQENEKKIADKIRADAIAALIATGDLPGDYK